MFYPGYLGKQKKYCEGHPEEVLYLHLPWRGRCKGRKKKNAKK